MIYRDVRLFSEGNYIILYGLLMLLYEKIYFFLYMSSNFLQLSGGINPPSNYLFYLKTNLERRARTGWFHFQMLKIFSFNPYQEFLTAGEV